MLEEHVLLTGVELTATCWPTKEELLALHPAAADHGRHVERCGGRVLAGVDATTLHSNPALWTPPPPPSRDEAFLQAAATPPPVEPQGYDRVVFNFPQHPLYKKIHKHRGLLKSFFASVRPLVEPCDGQVWVTLKGGQGGTQAELEGFARDFRNTWQVQEQVLLSLGRQGQLGGG